MHRRWLSAAFVSVGLLLPVASAHGATCPGADTTISPATVSSAKAAVLCIVNAERTARGLPALAANDALAAAAQAHSDDMVANDYFAHNGPDGSTPASRVLAAGYVFVTMFENIAVGQTTPREAVAGWLASTHGHCEATLNPAVRDLGVGVAPTPATLGDQIGGTWTEEFGLAAGALPASTDTGPADGCPYTSLIGIDPAPPPGAGSGAPTTPTTPNTPTTPSTPALPQTLNISLRHAGNVLTVSGSLRPLYTQGKRATIVVKRGRRTLRRASARLDARGRFRVRMARLPGRGPLTVRVSVGALHITRTVGR